MPQINISLKHALGQDEALKKIKGLIESTMQGLTNEVSDYKIDWQGAGSTFNFRVRNINIQGQIKVENATVYISSKLPIILLPLRSQIEKTISEHASKVLKTD